MLLQYYICRCKLQTLNFKNLLKPLVIIRAYNNKLKKPQVDASFTESYLKNTCGLSGKPLIRACNLVSLKPSNRKPDSVLKLFESLGFSKTHVAKLVSRFPSVLHFNVDKTLKPKLEFLHSMLESDDEFVRVVVSYPLFLSRNLENQIIPVSDLLSRLLGGRDYAVEAIKCKPSLLCSNLKHVVPNVEFLQVLGLPQLFIFKLVTAFGSGIDGTPERFSEALVKVKEMGFSPESSFFFHAVTALAGGRDWESKVEVHKSLGFSEEEVLYMFKKQPIIMSLSAKKIRAAVEFYTNKLRWSPSRLSNTPNVILYSLDKCIIPRCSVLQVLASRNWRMPKKIWLTTIIAMSERKFLENYVTNHMDEVPEALDAYQGKLRFEEYNFGS